MPITLCHRLPVNSRMLVLGTLLLTLSQCHKSEVAPSLPAESTSGANTAGCLVDGSVLLPRDGYNKSGTSLAYQLGTTAHTAWFDLGLSDVQNAAAPFISIQADSLVLEEGKSYAFGAGKGVPTALCATSSGNYFTTSAGAGTLTITRLDRAMRLIAGRFEFVGTDKTTGKQVHVTEGRFDYKSE